MEIGKVSNEVLEHVVFTQLGYQRPEVLVGSGIGEDCAVLDLGDELCVVSTDPITGATSDLGRLLVHVACNDIASAGAEPVGMTLTVLVPPGTTETELQALVGEASDAAARIGVQIIGGHTEVTDAVTRILVSATVIGRQRRDRMILTGGAAVGDALIMTKHAGLEGASILVAEREADLGRVLTARQMETARRFGDELSVVPEGRVAAEAGVSAMHDATEGGVLGASWELAAAGGHGLKIDRELIPVREETAAICAELDLDPLRLVSSGVMLMTVPPERLEPLLTALSEAGIEATRIGTVVDGRSTVIAPEGAVPLEPPAADELYKALQ